MGGLLDFLLCQLVRGDLAYRVLGKPFLPPSGLGAVAPPAPLLSQRWLCLEVHLVASLSPWVLPVHLTFPPPLNSCAVFMEWL